MERDQHRRAGNPGGRVDDRAPLGSLVLQRDEAGARALAPVQPERRARSGDRPGCRHAARTSTGRGPVGGCGRAEPEAGHRAREPRETPRAASLSAHRRTSRSVQLRRERMGRMRPTQRPAVQRSPCSSTLRSFGTACLL
jgi:hypothetical protein